jgi:ABC-type branched-subunit amino acid transport system substrate-binding protein
MTAGRSAVLALMLALANLGIGQAAPPEEKTSPANLAARLGKLVGAAYACPEVAKTRIDSVKKKITEALDGDRSGKQDASPAIKTFDDSLILGFQAAVKQPSDCLAVEQGLASLENITTAGRSAVLTLMLALADLGTGHATLPEEKTSPASLAARLGKLVGAAYACPEVAKTRIDNVRKKITEALDGDRTGKQDASPAIKIFDDSLILGFQDSVKQQSDCMAVEQGLASLENITEPGAGPGLVKESPAQHDRQLGSPALLDSQQAAQSAKQTSDCANGISDNEIRFGIAAPLTGATKNLGQQMRIGIETAFNETNAAGGIHGRQLKLISTDDGYEPARTLQAMKELCERQNVFAFIGNVGTPTAGVAVPYALEKRKLFFGAFTGANVVRNDPPDRYVFNYRASYAEETDAAVNYLVSTRGITPEEIAVFAQDDSFGDAGYSGVTAAIQKLRGNRGGEVTLRLSYKRNTENVAKAVADLKARPRPVKAIVIVATYGAAARFIQKSREQFANLIYTNVSFVGSTALRDRLKQLNVKDTKDIIVTQVVPPVEGYSSLVMKYKVELAKHFPNESQDYVSLEGYITARLLIEAINRAGQDLDAEKLVETLENMHDVDLGLGFRMNFSKDEHQGSHKVWATRLTESGNFEILRLQ